jgi:hypothetical protein
MERGRVVREVDQRLVPWNLSRRGIDIRIAFIDIIYACEPESVPRPLSPVVQHHDSRGFQRAAEQRRIAALVVVPQAGIYSVLRPQTRHHFHGRKNVPLMFVYKVAGKSDIVWLERIGNLQRIADQLVRVAASPVQIAQLYNRYAARIRVQVVQYNVVSGDLQLRVCGRRL